MANTNRRGERAVKSDTLLTTLTSLDDTEHARTLLNAILDSSDDAVVSKTLTGIVLSWNGAAERLFGFSAEEMVGQSITRIIPTELHFEETEILAKVRRGERIERYETVRVTKDGRKLDISLTISPVRDSSGTIVGAAKIAHDITDRRRAQREIQEREAELSKLVAERDYFLASERSARSEAERLSHLKDEFLATLSHELRTPLNAILGWTTLLQQKPLPPNEVKRGLQTIERNVRIQTEIINDLLDMSRIISGKLHLEVQSLLLQEVIQNAVEAVRQSAEAKRIRIHSLLDTRIGRARGDPNRLQQVVWNLLSNAIKFTPQGGRVQVILERVNSHAEISVIDNGIGISPEFLPFVFERFRQADPSLTRKFGGLGIGLSLVKNLVELHGGSVRVKSPGEGKGTTFSVALPIAHVDADESRRASQQTLRSGPVDDAELPRLDNVRILIVDDESDGREVIARLLQGRGAEAHCAASAASALELLGRERFDLLLSDIGMPDMDGFELIRRVRALDQPRESPLPAIAITAYARPEDRQRSLLAGFHMHLSKPIDARELVASVAGLLHLTR
jgi:PAS domain S-box-containing protein